MIADEYMLLTWTWREGVVLAAVYPRSRLPRPGATSVLSHTPSGWLDGLTNGQTGWLLGAIRVFSLIHICAVANTWAQRQRQPSAVAPRWLLAFRFESLSPNDIGEKNTYVVLHFRRMPMPNTRIHLKRYAVAVAVHDG